LGKGAERREAFGVRGVKEIIPLLLAAIALLLAIVVAAWIVILSARAMHTGAAADQGQFADVLCTGTKKGLDARGPCRTNSYLLAA
jgi:hypothetical protein